MAITQCTIIKKEKNSTPENRLFAAAQLGEIAYKLYIYIDSYSSQILNYERIKFVKTIDTNYKSADKAFQILIEKGYLIPRDENNYIFISRVEENTRIQF